MTRLDTRQRAGLGIAVGIVVTVTLLVALFGIVPFPEVGRVDDPATEPLPGRLAYTTWETGEGQCVHVVDGRGNDEQLGCGGPYVGETLGWTEDGYLTLGVERELGGWSEQLIDPVTGAVVEEREAEARPLPIPERTLWHDGPTSELDGRTARVDSRGGEVRVTVTDPAGRVEVLWASEAPQTYRMDGIRWSPDGEWLLLRDSLDRLLVLDAAGGSAPRVWVEEIEWEYAWYIRGVTGSTG